MKQSPQEKHEFLDPKRMLSEYVCRHLQQILQTVRGLTHWGLADGWT